MMIVLMYPGFPQNQNQQFKVRPREDGFTM